MQLYFPRKAEKEVQLIGEGSEGQGQFCGGDAPKESQTRWKKGKRLVVEFLKSIEAAEARNEILRTKVEATRSGEGFGVFEEVKDGTKS
ncbi:hypothetical protein HZB94_04020 [Candidatus Falkowbacteria bacterium]|nr:hypothetical protein [Candidatus Falkowbacteria bacterium]